MFFIFSKILDFFLMPYSWILVGVLYALFTKIEKRRKKALWSVIFVIVIIGNGYLENQALLWWEVQPNTQLSGKYDVGIILTGAVTNPNKTPLDSIYGGRSMDRMLQPVLFYKQGLIKKIVVSGGKVEILGIAGYRSETPMIVKCLINLGVKPEDILTDNESRNTRENALFSAKILKAQFPNQRYVLFTSAFHMRRSVGCFKKVGIEVTPYSCNFLSSAPTINFEKMIPNYIAFERFSILIHEISGYLIYRLMGYV